jgi:putative FmdB family regulatory protein
MPTYDYRCPNGHDFEHIFRKISDAEAELKCPVCGAVAQRRVSGGAGLVFKGSGFYLTDYGKNAHRKGSSGSAAASSDGGSSESKSESSSESKSATSASSSGESAGSSSKSEPAPAKTDGAKGDSKSTSSKPKSGDGK